MYNGKDRSAPITDINGLVATFLEDVAKRPVPCDALARFAEIRQAVAEGSASVYMALDIMEIFPRGGA